MLTGNTGYDLVTPSTDFLPREIAAGALRKLDKGLLPNISNLDPEIVRRVATRDPGNEYAVPYAWGTIGIGYDAAKVEAIMPDAPVDSWKLIFDPEVLSRFESCGISVLDAPGDTIPSTLLWLGKDPTRQYIDRLANGELCIVVGCNGDVLQARARAAVRQATGHQVLHPEGGGGDGGGEQTLHALCECQRQRFRTGLRLASSIRLSSAVRGTAPGHGS